MQVRWRKLFPVLFWSTVVIGGLDGAALLATHHLKVTQSGNVWCVAGGRFGLPRIFYGTAACDAIERGMQPESFDEI
ncbi:MAG TPA: hypothetical protein V6D29_06770 [Leptolyngbyaceae cyanobacterium]